MRFKDIIKDFNIKKLKVETKIEIKVEVNIRKGKDRMESDKLIINNSKS